MELSRIKDSDSLLLRLERDEVSTLLDTLEVTTLLRRASFRKISRHENTFITQIQPDTQGLQLGMHSIRTLIDHLGKFEALAAECVDSASYAVEETPHVIQPGSVVSRLDDQIDRSATLRRELSDAANKIFAEEEQIDQDAQRYIEVHPVPDRLPDGFC